MEEDHRHETDGNDCECADRRLLELLERSEIIDMSGQGLEVEGPEQERRRQLLHGIDKDKQRRRRQRRLQERQMDAPERAQNGLAKGPCGGVEIGRYAPQTGIDSPERNRHETDGIGKKQSKNASRQEQARREAEAGSHQAVEPIVETRKRDEQTNRQHRPGHRIAKARKPHGRPRQAIARNTARIGEHQSKCDRRQCRGGAQQEAVEGRLPEPLAKGVAGKADRVLHKHRGWQYETDEKRQGTNGTGEPCS